MRSALLAVALAACYRPDPIASCEIACDDLASTATQARCPDGLSCASSGSCAEGSEVCPPRGDERAGSLFGTPVPVGGGLQTAAEEDDPSLTEDLLELYLLSNTDLYVSTRATPSEPWPSPTRIVELNTPFTEQRPRISSDGLTIYFARRLANDQPYDIFMSTRATRGGTWATPTPVAGDINTPTADEIPCWISPDGLTMLFEAPPPDSVNHDLYLARRPSLDAPFVREAPLSINSVEHDGGGWFNADGTILVFESRRSGNTGIWEAYRDTNGWTAVLRKELDTPLTDGTPWLSPDGRMIVFSTTRPTGTNDDLYFATR